MPSVDPKHSCPLPSPLEKPPSRRSNLNRAGLSLGSFEDYHAKDESLEEWKRFLADYASGAFSPPEQPPLPALSPRLTFTSPRANKDEASSEFPFQSPVGTPERIQSLIDSGDESKLAIEEELPPEVGTDFTHPVYNSVDITPRIASRVRQFYLRHGYLPPPRAPLEVVREQIIKEYELYSEQQIQNIQAAVDLVQAYMGGICHFSLFQNNVQVMMAVSGPPDVLQAVGLYQGLRILPETSLCGHCVLLPAGSKHMYIPDLSKDWRYSGNPYANAEKGVRTYIGATVSLDVNPASPDSSQSVGVGVINSMHLDGVLPPLTPAQNKVLSDVARFLTEILRATWEGRRRTREARSRLVVSNFLDHIMLPRLPKSSAISPSQQLRWHLGKHEDHDEQSGSDSATSRLDARSTAQLQRVKSRDVADGQRPLLTPSDSIPAANTLAEEEADPNIDPLQRDAAILVKNVRHVLTEVDGAAVVDLRSLHAYQDARGGVKYVMDPESVHALNTIAWNSSSTTTPRPDFFAPPARKALMQSLYIQQHDREHSFVLKDNKTSGLEPYLPATTCSHLIIPFMAGNQPLFSIIVTSSTQYWSFGQADEDFVRIMGVILRAQILQNRVVEADMAKTTFLSSISHELRTPLHGLMSGLQLFEEAIESEDLGQAADLLPIIKNSGYALQNILNDMLQFGQLAHDNSKNKKSNVNLGDMVMSAVKTCIPRYFTWHKGTMANVKISVECEDRDWVAKIDESGFQRILFNGITNAMKVTKSGNIVVSLVTSSKADGVTLRIIDTGPGIDPKFASKLFQPFSKADSFNPGAGLGLYITKALVERMLGTISLYSTPGSQGATFEVNLPVTLVSPNAQDGSEVKVVRHEIDMVAAEKCHGRSDRLPVAEPTNQDGLSCQPQKHKSQTTASTPITPELEIDPPPIPFSEPLRVLIVEDNDISRKILVTLLRKMGKDIPIETTQATDGLEAVAAFEPFQPHLVLTDVSMPNMDGIAASTEMRKIERERLWERCKIYAITGLGSSDPRLKVAALRDDILDGWIVKGKDGLTGIRQIVEDCDAQRRLSFYSGPNVMEGSESMKGIDPQRKKSLVDATFHNAMKGLWPGANTAPCQNTAPAAPLDSMIVEQRHTTSTTDRDRRSSTSSNSGHKRRLSSVSMA